MVQWPDSTSDKRLSLTTKGNFFSNIKSINAPEPYFNLKFRSSDVIGTTQSNLILSP